MQTDFRGVEIPFYSLMHQDFALTDLKDENTSGLHTANDTRIAAYAKRIDGADQAWAGISFNQRTPLVSL